MRNTLLFLLLPLFLYQTLGFTCATVPTQSKCVQLTNCTWTTSCTGTYVPACVPPVCYYVDSYSTATATETGQLDNPYKTISAALNKLLNTTGTIIVLNYITNGTADLTQGHVLNAGVTTIKALFSDTLYFLNLTRVPQTTSSVTFFKINSAAQLVIMNALYSFEYPAAATQYTFDIANGNLTLINFHVLNSFGSRGTFFRVSPINTNSIITYNGGTFINSYAKSATYGTATIKNVVFEDMGTIGTLFSFSGTVTLDGVTYRRGAVNAVFLTISQNAVCTIKNSLFEDTSTFLLSSSSAKKVWITNTTFQGLAPVKPTPLYFKDVSTDGTATILIEDSYFINNSLSSSHVMVEKNGINLTLNRVQMINITKSTVNEEDAQYASEWTGGVCALSRSDASVLVVDSNFTDIGYHCLGIKASALTITGSMFSNSNYTKPTLTANMLSSLNDKSGVTWIHVEDATTVVTGGSKITLTGNKFLSNNMISKYGGAIRFIGVMTSQAIFTGNEFAGNTAFYGGAVYSSNTLMGFNLSNNTFSENSAYDGGAVYKKSKEFSGKIYTPSVAIDGDQFIENSAIRNGGATVFDWESLCIQGASFEKNTAQNGGAVYIINIDSVYNSIYGCLRNTDFTQNSALDVGGAFKIYFDYSALEEDPTSPAVFTGNTAYKGDNISSEKPTYYMFSFYNVLLEWTFSEFDNLSDWVHNSTKTSLAYTINTSDTSEDLLAKRIIHKSGHELTHIIKLEILNGKNEVVDYIRGEQVSVTLPSYENTISSFEPFIAASPVLFTFEDGKIYMKNTVQIVGEPKTTATILFSGLKSSSNLLSDANLLLSFKIPLYFQDCEIGDIFDNTTKTCDTCTSGTYSLADPYQDAACIECDKTKANCLGGSKIAVLPGFWRYSASSASIMECPADEACLGGFINQKYYEVGICGDEYQGNLCNKCIPNYAKFGSSDSCIDCRRDGTYYLKFVGFLALQVIAVVYSVKVNLSKITSAKKARSSNNMELSKKLKNEDFQSNLMKIVVNFLQVSSLIVQYKFEWPDFILEVWEVTNKFIPTEKDGFSIDCLVALITQDNQYLQFIKLVVTLFQPFGLWVALVLGYMVILKIQKEKLKGNPKLKKNVLVLFIITAFILQPSIVQACLEIFKCQNLRDADNPTYFMVKDPEVQCWTVFHITWSVGIALPFFLLWGVILPFVLFRKLKSTEKELQDTEVYSKFAFVYVGLKSKRYYWEFVNLIRKTMLIIIFVFLNMISIQTQAFATFLVILVFGVLHVKCRPYNDKRLNRLELLSLVTLGIMIYSGMFFLSGGSTSFTTILLIVIAFIFNMLFYLATGLYFLKSYKRAAKKITRSVTTKIRGSLDKVISRRSSDSNNSSVSSIDKKDNSIVDANQIGEMLSEINVQLNNRPDIASPKSNTDASHIPSEEDSDQNDKKTVYADRKEEANYSIMKNSGYYNPPMSLHNSGYNLPGLQSGLQSFHNSTVGLLSPAGNQRQFSFLGADRFLRPLNSMDVSHQDDNLDTPGTPPRAKSRFRSGFEDTPRRDSPNLKLDELLVLKNSPSSPRRSPNKDEDENEGK